MRDLATFVLLSAGYHVCILMQFSCSLVQSLFNTLIGWQPFYVPSIYSQIVNLTHSPRQAMFALFSS